MQAIPPDVQQMIDAHLASGQYTTADEVLRDALRALNDEEEDLAAVRDAIAEWKAGDDGTPLAEAFDAIRRSTGSIGSE